MISARPMPVHDWRFVGPSARRILFGCAIGGSAVLVGAAAAYGYGTPAIAGVTFLAVVWLAWAHLSYLVPAALLLLTMNAIPGFDLEKYTHPGSFRPEDIFVIGLIVFAAGRMLVEPQKPLPRLQRYLWIWSPLFLLIWLGALVRGMDAGGSLLHSALFGRDFLYFALLAPLAGYLFRDRRDSRRFVLIVGCWTAMLSVLLMLAQLKVLDATVVNASLTKEIGSILRIYTPILDLVVITFALSLAHALLESGAGSRWAALIATVTGLVCVLSLTRALYGGMILGIAITVAIWAIRGGIPGRRVRRRLGVTVAAVVIAVGMSAALIPEVTGSDAVSTVSTRAGKGVTDLTGITNRAESTLAEREYVADVMTSYLGDRWPLGVGLVPPTTYYLSGVPHGSIRDPDLGLLSGVMTIGVLGTVALFVPIVLMLGALLRRRPEESEASTAAFGLVLWAVVMLASSVTLVFLFTTGGLVTAALALGYAGEVGPSGRREISETHG